MDNFQIGSIVVVTDGISEAKYVGTIRFIEVEDGITWLYVRLNEENMNTETDPRFPGTYYKVFTTSQDEDKASNNIKPIERIELI